MAYWQNAPSCDPLSLQSRPTYYLYVRYVLSIEFYVRKRKLKSNINVHEAQARKQLPLQNMTNINTTILHSHDGLNINNSIVVAETEQSHFPEFTN